MAKCRIAVVALGAMFALAGGTSQAQQSQTVIDQPKQTPNRSAIPEKVGPPLEAKKPSAGDVQAAPGNEGRQLPEGQQLDMKDPVPNTGGTAPVPPSKPEAQ